MRRGLAAGQFVNGVVVARIPLFLFQAVQAALLPKLSALATAGQLGDFRSASSGCWSPVAGLAVVGTIVGAVLGPFVVEIMFPDSDLGARTMGLLAAGGGLHAGHGVRPGPDRTGRPPPTRRSAGSAGCVALALTARFSSQDVFFRVELGLLVGSAAALLVMGVLLVRRLAVAGPLHVDSGDLIEAIHDVAIEP